jgi:UDP-2-acetamido-3-amino-2,3-dideoxy-glucuronate N-acetyltransferase
MKVAVVGSGYWGRNLVRNYAELGALYGVCDTNEQSLDAFRQKYPQARYTSNYLDLLGDDAVRGIVIATPAETHFTLAREALLSGKDVFVEKPLALNVGEAEELRSIAEKGACILMVGHLLQYHSAFIRL